MDIGVYRAIPPTLQDNTPSPILLDQNGRPIVILGQKIAGEDSTNDVMKVEERFSNAYISAIATTAIKASAGFLHAITVGETAAGAITVYDNTIGAGTIIAVLKASIVEQTFIFDVNFTVGLTIVTAAASKISVSYR